MRLKTFLNYFGFDYRYDDDEIALIDLQDGNLGNIEKERFPKGNLSSIVDRLDIYYKDCIFDNLADKYSIHPDDWGKIYKKAIEKNDSSLEYLKVIMDDEKLTLYTVIHDIKWDTDGEEVNLPEYMVIPENISDDKISDYISDQTGFTFLSYKPKMIFIDWVNLFNKLIKNGTFQYDANINNGSILIYRAAGETTPESWYWQNVMEAASEIFHDETSQIALINEINKKY